jgi:DNA-binding CsgD family transcriptional regulator
MTVDEISIVESVYASRAVDAHEWLKDLLRASSPLLEQGLGAAAFAYEPDGEGVRITAAASLGCPQGFLEALGQANAEMTPEARGLLYGSGPVGTASEQLGAPLFERESAFRAHFRPLGIEDFFAVIGSSPDGSGCALGVPLPRVERKSRAHKARWAKVAAHVSAGYRLRTALGVLDRVLGAEPLGSETEAVLTPEGRTLDATGAAASNEGRRKLEAAVAAMTRSRDISVRRANQDEALALWQGLVDGTWSLVESRDSDGKRLVVVVRNAPGVPPIRGLSTTERAVIGLILQGHSQKQIAYELGYSPAHISGVLSSTQQKLGLKHLSELLLFFRGSRS